jgi:hypothetical protein
MVMTPTSRPAGIDHGGRDQVVLVEHVGDLGLLLGRLDGAELLFGDVGHRRVAPRRQHPAQRHMPDRPVARVDQDDVIELVGQPFDRAQVVDGLADRPVLRHRHRFRLHQPAGGIFRPGHGAFDRGPVVAFQRLQDEGLVAVLQILQHVDDIVRIKLAHRVGQHVARQRLDHLLADRFVQLRQDLAVDLRRIERQQRAPLRR